MWSIITEIALHAQLDLPALEVTILLIAMTICLVCKFSRSGLIIAYLFAYKWGWRLFVEEHESLLMAYLVFGVITGILTVVGMIFARHHD